MADKASLPTSQERLRRKKVGDTPPQTPTEIAAAPKTGDVNATARTISQNIETIKSSGNPVGETQIASANRHLPPLEIAGEEKKKKESDAPPDRNPVDYAQQAIQGKIENKDEPAAVPQNNNARQVLARESVPEDRAVSATAPRESTSRSTTSNPADQVRADHQEMRDSNPPKTEHAARPAPAEVAGRTSIQNSEAIEQSNVRAASTSGLAASIAKDHFIQPKVVTPSQSDELARKEICRVRSDEPKQEPIEQSGGQTVASHDRNVMIYSIQTSDSARSAAIKDDPIVRSVAEDRVAPPAKTSMSVGIANCSEDQSPKNSEKAHHSAHKSFIQGSVNGENSTKSNKPGEGVCALHEPRAGEKFSQPEGKPESGKQSQPDTRPGADKQGRSTEKATSISDKDKGHREIGTTKQNSDDREILIETAKSGKAVDRVFDQLIDRMNQCPFKTQCGRLADVNVRRALAQVIDELENGPFDPKRFRDPNKVRRALRELGPENLKELRTLLNEKSDAHAMYADLDLNKKLRLYRFINIIFENCTVRETGRSIAQNLLDKLKSLQLESKNGRARPVATDESVRSALDGYSRAAGKCTKCNTVHVVGASCFASARPDEKTRIAVRKVAERIHIMPPASKQKSRAEPAI